MQTEYFGQPFQSGSEPVIDQARPDHDFYEDGQLSINAASRPTRIYARVRFAGQYGVDCAEFQNFERTNLTTEKARDLARLYFGSCPHEVHYFTADGEEVRPK